MWGRGSQCTWSACAQFSDWLALRWRFKYHQPPGFNWSGVYMLRQQFSSCVWVERVCFLQKQVRNVCQALMSFRKVEFGDSAIQLHFCPLETTNMYWWNEDRAIFYYCGSLVIVSDVQAFTQFVLLSLLGWFAEDCSPSLSKMATVLYSCLSWW